MTDIFDPHSSSTLDSVAEQAERLQRAITTRTATATSTDGTVTVEVSADGAVHHWQFTDTGYVADPRELVATVIDLIGQARIAAHDQIRADIDALSQREDLQNVCDTVRDTLARTPPHSSATVADDSWDEDYYDRGKSRIAAE